MLRLRGWTQGRWSSISELIGQFNHPTLTCRPTFVPGRDRRSSEEPSSPLQTSGVSGWSSHWVSQSDERVLEWRPVEEAELRRHLQTGTRCHHPLNEPPCFTLKHRLWQCPPLLFAVPGHQQREESKHHRLHAENVGAIQLQPGGSDQRANRRAGGGEEQDREVGGTAAAKVRAAS